MGLPAESIDGHRVRVRRFRDEDADDILAGCTDPLTRRFLHQLPDPYTHQDAVWWITEGSAAVFAAGGGAYAIADPESDRLLGAIGVTNVRGGDGEIGYWVGPWARRRGVATGATRTLTDYAFSVGYGRLALRTEPENEASQRVALACGYLREGVQRGGGLGRDGDRHDVIVWSRLADDPPGPSPRLLPDLPGGELTDGVVTLRPLGPADAADVHAVRCLPEVIVATVPPFAPSATDTAASCARAAASWLAGASARMSIRDTATDAFAGEITLYRLEPTTGQASVGYDLGPVWRGRGYATRALRLLAGWVFTETAVARLVAGAAPDNVASQRVLERAGFTREGYQRGRLPAADGGRVDDLLYALLPQDL